MATLYLWRYMPIPLEKLLEHVHSSMPIHIMI